MSGPSNEEPFGEDPPADGTATHEQRTEVGRGARPQRPSKTIDDLATDLERCWTLLEEGSADVHQVRRILFRVVDSALGDDLDDTPALLDYALAIAQTVSEDVRHADPLLAGALRSHLDYRLATAEAQVALRQQLVVLDAGLSFGCVEQINDLIDLCRSGRGDNVVLFGSSEAAADVVRLAVKHACVAALEATLWPSPGPQWRLGWHYAASTEAFDGLASIAWRQDHTEAPSARAALVELLQPPGTCLDSATRILPTWLAHDADAFQDALRALDMHENGLGQLPTGTHPQDLLTTIHALRSLLWLAQDASTSARNHGYWFRP